MSAASKFAHLRSPHPLNPTIALYLRTIETLAELKSAQKVTGDEADAHFARLQDATWEVQTIEAIQSVRDEIAKTVK